jgi:hypothetical protein
MVCAILALMYLSCWKWKDTFKLVAEAGDSSGTQRKGNVRRWKPLPRNGREYVTEDTCVCVCVCVIMNCKVKSRAK